MKAMQSKIFIADYSGAIIELLAFKAGKFKLDISVMEDDKIRLKLLIKHYPDLICPLSFDKGVALISNSGFNPEFDIELLNYKPHPAIKGAISS